MPPLPSGVPNPVAEGRAVRARNFPAAWIAPTALVRLPQMVEKLLQRIGSLEGSPVSIEGPFGLEVIANFASAALAQKAVRTLHGYDLRTEKEKAAVNYQAPKETERFWLQTVEVEGGSSGSTAKPGARPKVLSVHLSPLPASWAEHDVVVLATPYGTVTSVKLQVLNTGKKGADIEFQNETAAQVALTGLNGLSLMGERLRCVMQEPVAPPKPVRRLVVHLDEVTPDVCSEMECRMDDRELFILALPRTSRAKDSALKWLRGFGQCDQVFLLTDAMMVTTGQAYARFHSHPEAAKALESINATATDAAGKQARWSQAERFLRGSRSSFGFNALQRLIGKDAATLVDIGKACGLESLTLEGGASASAARLVAGEKLHFVARYTDLSQVDECKSRLAAELARVHEAYVREVKGCLVLRGFTPSWSEKGLKFVFAPFGGLSSVVLDEERTTDAAAAEKPSTRLAFVRLRNTGAAEKAVENLHQKKVGDGDLVEECIVTCTPWYLHAWSSGDYLATFFLDQLSLPKRSPEVGPGSTDRELYVRNLPLQDMNRPQLKEYFEGFGEVEDLYLLRDLCTNEPTSEGYVRFKQHSDAVRCIEALTPEQEGEAEATDLVGQWSESERALQRKNNCYRFNLISELVGIDGTGLARLKADAKLKCLWLLGESLQQKDKYAPPPFARQLHFAARCTDESQVRLFKDRLEKTLQSIHKRIANRIAKRKAGPVGSGEADSPAEVAPSRKKAKTDVDEVKKAPPAAVPPAAAEAPAAKPAAASSKPPEAVASAAVARAPAGTGGGPDGGPWQPPSGWGWRPPPMPGGIPPGPCPPMMGGPFGYYPPPGPLGHSGPPGAWGQAQPQQHPPASVFEQASSGAGAGGGKDVRAASKSHRRKHRDKKDDKDKRRRKRHRRRDKSSSSEDKKKSEADSRSEESS
mmetsp:Transcript_70625/g.169232  ORF Transcript_70625/g.169232 Transcript_70625/m.169232 type:complete len:925 (-) Transcript_70625:192-2966(-)|eukprot:CAMPEP_0178383900 /NCGR_PEP_ID=MMETSP0689_2-20121128/7238_1 /TAXON_ID=160604 /ORGANISM="Amphidinium massartii, Strain CS-259" /LENGTH=924 /DNA_ID=CAMNT_0020004131 /DNA_START=9 /DNA_END=2783 /DNA_ORIENTATION=-